VRIEHVQGLVQDVDTEDDEGQGDEPLCLLLHLFLFLGEKSSWR
jgi:hypothetical protein